MLSNGDWTPHDLRRTGATFMQSLGVGPGIIERVLNHTEPNKLKRTYQTYAYGKEMREAWRLLGDKLALLVPANATGAEPVELSLWQSGRIVRQSTRQPGSPMSADNFA